MCTAIQSYGVLEFVNVQLTYHYGVCYAVHCLKHYMLTFENIIPFYDYSKLVLHIRVLIVVSNRLGHLTKMKT